MGNFLEEFIDAHKLEGDDPVSRMFNPKLPKPPPPGPLESALAGMYKKLLKQTDPLRKELISQSNTFLQGGMDVGLTPEFNAIRSMADSQGKLARENILSSLPGGGVLLDKLADVDIEKARTLTSASSDIYNNQLNRAMSLATGSPFQGGVTGLGGLAQNELARSQAAQAQQAGQKNALGSAVGGIAGGYFGGPGGAAAGSSAGGSMGSK